MEKEIWKPIKGFESIYEISNKGRVKYLSRTMWNGQNYWVSNDLILKHGINNRGYHRVDLRKGGKTYKIDVHRLVAEAFIPNKFDKETVNHINGNKNDNTVNNLEWNTYSENLSHAIKTGLRKLPDNKGINNPAAKLNGEKVKEIRRLYKARKYTQDELAKIFKVSRSSIGNIVTYKTWNPKNRQ